jgi:hypothetical protein
MTLADGLKLTLPLMAKLMMQQVRQLCAKVKAAVTILL